MKYLAFFLLTFWCLYSFAQEEILSLPFKHDDELVKLQYAPDKRFLYTVSKDLTIRLWYIKDNKTVRTFSGLQSEITDLTALQNNSMLFAADKNGNIYQWNTQTGQLVYRLTCSSSVTSLCIDEANQYLIAGEKAGKIIFYQLSDLKPIKTIETTPYFPVTILKSKEPYRYFVGFCKLSENNEPSKLEKGNIQFYDLQENRFFPVSSNSENISLISFSPDSSKLLAASAENKIIRIFDTNKLIEETTIKVPFRPSTVFASRTNKMIGIGSAESSIFKGFRHTGEEILSFSMDSGTIVFGEFNYDITRIHLANTFGVFNIYDFQANKRENIGNYTNIQPKVTVSAYNQTNKLLALGFSNGKSLLFSLTENKLEMLKDSFNTQVESICFDSSANLLALYYQPYYKYSENNYAPDILSKLTVFDLSNNNIVIYTKTYQDEYITSIGIFNGLLFTGFNTGKLEIYHTQQNKKIVSTQVVPYDITHIYLTSDKKLWLQCIDQNLYQFDMTEKYQFTLKNKISLRPNENILDINNQQLITNQRLIDFTSTNSTPFPSQNAFFLSTSSFLSLNNHLLTFYEQGSKKWETTVSLAHIKNIHLDNQNQFIVFINQYADILFCRLTDCSIIGNLKISPPGSWVYTSNLQFDGTPDILNQIKVVKGILYSKTHQIEALKTSNLLQQTVGLINH